MATVTRIKIPPAFKFLAKPARYKGAYGGRGSGKSWSFAQHLLLAGIQRKEKILCAREYQASIADSVKSLLDAIIARYPVMSTFYQSVKNEIRGVNGTSFIFLGIRHDPQKIKSLEGVTKCWVEEANTVSQKSLDILIPTIRAEGSEIWFSYNRKDPNEPVHEIRNKPDAIFREVNYYDNPFFPDTLRREMEWDREHDTGKYEHVWLGKPRVHSEAQVFHGRYRIERFETPKDAVFYFGADWGFSVDPTTLVRMWIDGRKLFIDYEAYGVGVEIDKTPGLFDTVPGSRDYIITADNARPETISYMRRQGFNIRPSQKGKGSVEEGIEFLKSYEIIIHERCKHVADEFNLYSYKTDRRTGDILPVLEDKNNHCIDAIRYAIEKVRRNKRKLLI